MPFPEKKEFEKVDWGDGIIMNECTDETFSIERANGFNNAIDLCTKAVSVKNLRQASAQGYCTERNSHKVVDPDLLEDICSAIHSAIVGGEG